MKHTSTDSCVTSLANGLLLFSHAVATRISKTIQCLEKQQTPPRQQLGGHPIPEGRLIPSSHGSGRCEIDRLGRHCTSLSHMSSRVATRHSEISVLWSPATCSLLFPTVEERVASHHLGRTALLHLNDKTQWDVSLSREDILFQSLDREITRKTLQCNAPQTPGAASVL